MWAEAIGLLEQAERRQRQFFSLAGPSGAQTRWEPPADVIETATEVQVTVALPGIEPGQIELQLDERGISVGARRGPPAFGGATVIRRLEIPYGLFARRIGLPPGRYELMEQAAEHGCLFIRLRKL